MIKAAQIESTSAMQEFTWCILHYCPKEGSVRPLAVLLLNRNKDELRIKFRNDLQLLKQPHRMVVTGLAKSLSKWATELGASHLFDYLLGTASNALQLTDPSSVRAVDAKDELKRLFNKHVATVALD